MFGIILTLTECAMMKFAKFSAIYWQKLKFNFQIQYAAGFGVRHEPQVPEPLRVEGRGPPFDERQFFRICMLEFEAFGNLSNSYWAIDVQLRTL